MTTAATTRIHRSPAQGKFTIHHNRVLHDTRLSWRALGLLAYLLSLPATWRLNIQHLASLRSEGRHSTRSALTELERYGYISKQQVRNSRGCFVETHWQVTDSPQPQAHNPQSAQPPSENPPADHRPLQKTKPKQAPIQKQPTTAAPKETIEQLLQQAPPPQKALYEALTAKVPLWIKNEPGWRLALARKARAGQLTGRIAAPPPAPPLDPQVAAYLAQKAQKEALKPPPSYTPGYGKTVLEGIWGALGGRGVLSGSSI